MSDNVTNADLKGELDLIRADLAYVKTNLSTMVTVVTGNGHPKEGLSSRVGILETVCERMERVWWLLAASTIAAVIGAVFAVVRVVKP